GLPEDEPRIRKSRIAGNVLDVDDSSLKYRAARRRAGVWRARIALPQQLERAGLDALVSHEVLDRTIEAEQRPVRALAQPHGVAHDGVKHRLHVGRRAGHDAQDLGRGGLLLERFLRLIAGAAQLELGALPLR